MKTFINTVIVLATCGGAVAIICIIGGAVAWAQEKFNGRFARTKAIEELREREWSHHNDHWGRINQLETRIKKLEDR